MTKYRNLNGMNLSKKEDVLARVDKLQSEQ